jgi:hypothetical protein
LRLNCSLWCFSICKFLQGKSIRPPLGHMQWKQQNSEECKVIDFSAWRMWGNMICVPLCSKQSP